MTFSDIVHLLSSSFPLQITHGVHQFNVKNTHLQLMGDDHMLTAMVTPGALFATHLRSAGGGDLLVAFKSDAPECVGISGFDGGQSIIFRGINTFDDAPLLLKTLLLIIDFEDHLSEMVCDLWDKFADPLWSITIQPTSALVIDHECGSISLTHAEDCVYVFAYPLVGIYDRYIAWSGPPTFDGLRSGTLMLGDDVFVGAKDGAALSFAYQFPDDEDEIRGVMAALVWIFRAHLENC
jgi:hypothetical protein